MFRDSHEQMYNPGVFISRLDDLRRKKSYEERRNISLRTIAEETGLALTTVHRVKAGPVDKIQLATLNTLCHYFKVDSLDAVIGFTRDKETEARLEAVKQAPHPDRTADARGEYRTAEE
jgi:DNA-binding Xre family transcriptional regulator